VIGSAGVIFLPVCERVPKCLEPVRLEFSVLKRVHKLLKAKGRIARQGGDCSLECAAAVTALRLVV